MERIERLQALLDEHDLEALIIDSPIDLYYLTGQELSLGRLVVAREGAVLYVDGRYFEGCEQALSLPVVLNRGYGADTPFMQQWAFGGKRVGFDSDATSYAHYQQFAFLKSEMVPLPSPTKTLRMIKEPEEIEKLEEAATLGSEGFDFVLTLLEEGVTEEEIATELELFWRQRGAQRLAFAPHIAFGAGSSKPHYHPGDVSLKRGDSVLIDIGVVVDHYHSDMTRVVAFQQLPDALSGIYEIVREAHEKALAVCLPGVPAGDVDCAARDWITQKGYGEAFSHSTGHGVGLEIHEKPTIRKGSQTTLEIGMVITIEPGIYLPGIGGVRLEDTILITEDGYRNLTKRDIATSLPVI